MEGQFGFDFSRIRVHTDGDANRMSDELESLAFTHGSDIYFAAGMFRPETQDGRRLLAHELTHVIQQAGGAGPRPVQRFEKKFYYKGPMLSGKAVHFHIEESLRRANKGRGLITEAPIPGGTTDTVFVPTGGEEIGEKNADYFNKVGRADLYTSSTSPSGEAPGVRGIVGKEKVKDDPEARVLKYQDFKSEETRASTGSVTWQPHNEGAKKPFTGRFPEKFQVADLKPFNPLDPGKAGEGTVQIGNYIEGFQNFVEQAAADGKIAAGAPKSTEGSNLTGLTIPDGLRYADFDQENARENPSEGSLISGGPKGKVKTRYWVYEIPNLGLYLYFDLQHPFPAGTSHDGIRRAFEQLQPIRDDALHVRDDEGVEPALDVQSKRRSPHRRGRAVVQRKERPKKDWGTLGEKWEERREAWDRDFAKPLLASTEGKAFEERMKVDKRLGLSRPQTDPVGEDAKHFRSIERWSGMSGKLFGKVRFTFGNAFDKIAGFFQRIVERFKRFHAKMRGISPSISIGWQAKLVKAVMTGVKLAFTSLLNQLYSRFASCVNGLISKVVHEFTQDPSEKLAEELESLRAKYEDFKSRVEAEFESRFGSWDEFIEAVGDVTDLLKLASDVKTLIQFTAQVISCIEPPVLGCLWGLVVNITIEAAMELVAGTKKFQKWVVEPSIGRLINHFAGSLYQDLITDVLDLVGLKAFAAGAAGCGIPYIIPEKTIEDSLTVLAADALEGEALLQHRAEWQEKYNDQMKKEILQVLGGPEGKPLEEVDLVKLLEAMQDSGLKREELKEVIRKAPRTRDGKIDAKALLARLTRGRKGPRGMLTPEGKRPSGDPDLSVRKGLSVPPAVP
jgi:hypothetical protein